ncbi:DMT family transporter [Paeniglutamicibacter cryotolerans]|uniref:Quaternary ammonium compound-resistance protein SugE n=1 Tax=Paeniglutamicibacter cryotolerans TaxID=670079 RepID=A0A839QGV7_9MICC|nr:multidrug efflux SMR transporter [Paeniglutamicibacter cryotolerans]MBB2994957.1 quaternary ammonium compound-resistance protein SugE [Paeniglutamicibacter cryotolerans]
MSWIVLIISGLFEAVWAVALGTSEGFTKVVPSIVFGVGLVISMVGLAYAMREISTGTAYAVWVGIGASLAVGYGMIFGGESVSILKIGLIMLLIGCVVGLKFVD